MMNLSRKKKKLIALLVVLTSCSVDDKNSITSSSSSIENDTSYSDGFDSIRSTFPYGQILEMEADTFESLPLREVKHIESKSRGIYGDQYNSIQTQIAGKAIFTKIDTIKMETFEIESRVSEFNLPAPIEVEFITPEFSSNNFKIFNQHCGLASGKIRSITQDQKGRIWINHDLGISLTDGSYLWNILDKKDFENHELMHDRIGCDASNKIWILGDIAENGLSIIEENKKTTYDLQDGYDFFEDSKGNVWIGTADSGCIKFEKDGSIKRYKYACFTSDINEDSDGNICLSTEHGFFVIKETGIYKMHWEEHPFNYSKFVFDQQGVMWIINFRSQVLFSYDGYLLIKHELPMLDLWMYNIAVDNNNEIWIATWGKGLINYNRQVFNFIGLEQGLPNLFIWAEPAFDEFGNVLIGTMNGIGVFDPDANYSIESSRNGWMNAMQGSDGEIWLSKYNGSLNSIKNDSLIEYLNFDGEVIRHPGFVIDDANNVLVYWEDNFVLDNGYNLIYRKDGKWFWMDVPEEILKKDNRYMFTWNFSKNGKHYARVNANSLLIADSINWCNFQVIPEKTRLQIENKKNQYFYFDGLGCDENDIYWVVSPDIGIGQVSDGKIKWTPRPEGNTKKIIDVKISKDHPPLVLCDDNSIYSLENEIYHELYQFKSIPKSVNVLDYDLNRIIVGTLSDVYLYENGLLDRFSKSRDLGGVDFRDAFISKFDSALYVLCVEVVTKINLNQADSKVETINCQLVKIEVKDKLINKKTLESGFIHGVESDRFNNIYGLPDDLTLAYDMNRIDFHFSASDWSYPIGILYTYKLEGSDIDWTKLNSETSASFNNLTPGDYTFRLKSRSANGNWSNEISYHFTITPPWWYTWWAYGIYVTLIILIFYLVLRLRTSHLKHKQIELISQINIATKEIRQQKEEADEQKERIEVAHKEITDSIVYAKRIQSAILPPAKLIERYLPNSFILYKPKDVVAGDFYWLEQREQKTLFAAADCTGHGVPGALVSVICNNGLNRAVREHGLFDPGEILNKTREIVIQEFNKSDDDVKDGMDIALCSLEGMTLQFAAAQNPLWIIRKGIVEVEKQTGLILERTTYTYDESHNFTLIEVKADKQPIGKYANQNPFTTHFFELKSGDTFYIFTDGYQDQFGGDKSKKFKAANLKSLLISIQNETLERQKQIIDTTFESWKGKLEQVDDVCVIGVRV